MNRTTEFEDFVNSEVEQERAAVIDEMTKQKRSRQKKVPNPGSAEAVKQGCKCAVLDNNYGKGFPYGGKKPSFWVSENRKLHGKQ